MSIRIARAAESAYFYPLLIKHLLHTPLAVAPDQEIVYREHVRYTYRDFHRRIAQVANALARLGVSSGTTVAVMDWDSHRYLECYFAVPMMGAVLQTVNVRLAPAEIAYTLNTAAADILLVHRDFLSILNAIRQQLTTVRTFVLLEDTTGDPPEPTFAGAYETLVTGSSDDFTFGDFDENAIATTFHTTGTTGVPKRVCFTHRQIVLHTLAILAAFGGSAAGQSFHQGDVYMPLTPMFHVHAWGVPYAATLLGVKQVYPGRYDVERILELKRREGVTFSHCVPSILQMLLAAPAAQQADLTDWKIVVGGSALQPELARQALERGIDVFAAYGMSETCPFLTITRIDPVHSDTREQLRMRCRTGLPVPLVDLRVVNPDMVDLPHDDTTAGELVVRAPWLTYGYEGDEPQTRELWRGGYLHTQDVATIDPRGYVQIRDRLKDVIKSGGEWVSSLALEDLILRHPGVLEVAVVGISDVEWGERPVAIVVPRPDAAATLSEAAVIAHVGSFVASGTIPKYAVPDRVYLVSELDKTSVGKLDKKKLRQRYSGR